MEPSKSTPPLPEKIYLILGLVAGLVAGGFLPLGLDAWWHAENLAWNSKAARFFAFAVLSALFVVPMIYRHRGRLVALLAGLVSCCLLVLVAGVPLGTPESKNTVFLTIGLYYRVRCEVFGGLTGLHVFALLGALAGLFTGAFEYGRPGTAIRGLLGGAASGSLAGIVADRLVPLLEAWDAYYERLWMYNDPFVHRDYGSGAANWSEVPFGVAFLIAHCGLWLVFRAVARSPASSQNGGDMSAAEKPSENKHETPTER